jgi:uncharacterized protein YndB with AHSA1/START domain
MNTTTTDRIEKSVVLRAPRTRVWRALTDAEAFGQWFGVQMAGPFAPGGRVSGRITHPGYEHLPFEMTIERMEPERLTIVESGFDGIPLARRATAYRGNDDGWTQQMAAIERYLSGAA